MPEPKPPRVFISYSHDSPEHQDRVLDFADRLGADGVDATIDQYEQSPPQGWPTWCDNEIRNADFVLMVCTETYLRRVEGDEEPGKGHGVLWEARLIKQELYDSGSMSAKFVPVLFESGTIEDIPRPVRGTSYFQVETAGGYDSLYRLVTDQPFVRKPEMGKPRRLPQRQRKSFAEPSRDERPLPQQIPDGSTAGQAQAVSNIPIGIPLHFMGRDGELRQIYNKLEQADARVAITALHGLRGVGKTILAAAYAERHRSDYRATWWIRAETEAVIRSDLVGLGVRLGWIPRDEQEGSGLAIVLERLRQEGEGILLIFDSAISTEALRPYLPRTGFTRVIITSNAHAWRGVAEPVVIQVWPKEVGSDYLIARTGRTGERWDAQALSEALGGLPLAHEQAAAYCEQLEVPLAEYSRRFKAEPVRMLGKEQYAPAEYHPEYYRENHDRLTVAKAFNLAIGEAAKLHPAAAPLIIHAALLAPEPIPLFLFIETRDKLSEPLATALAGDGIDEVVAALRNFALIDRETIPDERVPELTTGSIRLHRLVREVAASRCDEGARAKTVLALIQAVASIYPVEVYTNPATWPRARRLDAIAVGLVSDVPLLPDGAEIPASNLMNRLSEYRCGPLGAFSEAQPLLEHALKIRESVLGEEHPDTAMSVHNLGVAYSERGDFGSARTLYERALAVREEVLGPVHPDTASTLSNLGSLLLKQGDHAEARPLLERALAIREKVLGPEHPDTATSLNNLGGGLSDQGDHAVARPLYERALAITEKVLGPEHPNTASTLSNLGSLLLKQGDHAEARPLLERALAIREKVLGPEHPDTANSLNNLGGGLSDQGDHAVARPLYERALAITEKVLGPEHPNTATTLSNLGSLLLRQGDHAEARPLLERALAIREKVLGPEHPDTANSLTKLGVLLSDQGDHAAARPLLERALAIREKVLGPEHADTANSLYNLGGLLFALRDRVAARPLFERTLTIREKVLGPEHPDTATSLINVAQLRLAQSNVIGARLLLQRALRIRERTLGPRHPDTLTLRRHLGSLRGSGPRR